MSLFEIIIFMKYFFILRNFLITFFYEKSDSKFIKDLLKINLLKIKVLKYLSI